MFEHPALMIEMYTQEMRRLDARNEQLRRIRERAAAPAAPRFGSPWRRMLNHAAPDAPAARDAVRIPDGGVPLSAIAR